MTDAAFFRGSLLFLYFVLLGSGMALLNYWCWSSSVIVFTGQGVSQQFPVCLFLSSSSISRITYERPDHLMQFAIRLTCERGMEQAACMSLIYGVQR